MPSTCLHYDLVSRNCTASRCCPQSGKAYTLNKVVPTVVAEVLRQQPPGHPLKGMAVLRLDVLGLCYQVCRMSRGMCLLGVPGAHRVLTGWRGVRSAAVSRFITQR